MCVTWRMQCVESKFIISCWPVLNLLCHIVYMRPVYKPMLYTITVFSLHIQKIPAFFSVNVDKLGAPWM